MRAISLPGAEFADCCLSRCQDRSGVNARPSHAFPEALSEPVGTWHRLNRSSGTRSSMPTRSYATMPAMRNGWGTQRSHPKQGDGAGLCDFLVTCRIYCCALWGSPEICHARAIGLSVKSREDEREKTGEALVKWPGFPFFLTTSATVSEVRFDQAYGGFQQAASCT